MTRQDKRWHIACLVCGCLLMGIGIGMLVPCPRMAPISSKPFAAELETNAYRQIRQLALTFDEHDPVTAANLLVVGAATIIKDQRRLGELLRRYNEQVLHELQQPRVSP